LNIAKTHWLRSLVILRFVTRANFSNFQVIKRPILIVVAQDKGFIDTVIMGPEGQIDGKAQPGWSESGAIPVYTSFNTRRAFKIREQKPKLHSERV
jgi:hypothetical protein